jgi:hypothetical protein
MRRRSLFVAPLALALALYAGSLPAVAKPTADGGPVDAIWQVQRFDFDYRSARSYYACGALQRKIGDILSAVGVHKSVTVEINCDGLSLMNVARASITLAAPVEATDENIRQATTFDGRAELLARMRNVPLPTAADIERFRAEWRSVSLLKNRQLSLAAADCDLLRNIRDQIFPKLSIRVMRDGLTCTQSATRLKPALDINVLMPAKPKAS